MVAPAPPSAPLSYAERAKRAQNIRSPIAAPPPPQNIAAPLPPSAPAPTPSVHVVVDSISASSAASAASTASTAPSSAAVSSSLSDDTPNSSIVLGTRASSPIPSTTFPPPNSNQNSMRPASKAVEQTRDGEASSSAQLAAKALSIVAAHSKPAPTPNVWSQRIERMSAARATTTAPSSGPTPNATQTSPPSATPTGGTIAANAAGATPAPTSVTPVTPSPSTAFSTTPTTAAATVPSISTEVWPDVAKSVLATLKSTAGGSPPADASQSGEEHRSAKVEHEANGESESQGARSTKGKAQSKWVHPLPAASLPSDAQGLKVASGKPKADQIAASTSLAKESDPFVVKVPAQQRLAPTWAAATLPSPPAPLPAPSSSSHSASVSMTPAAAAAASLGPAFSTTPGSVALSAISAEAWPEVGKSVLAASTSTVGDSPRVSVSQASESVTAGEDHGMGRDEAEGVSDGKGTKNKKGKAKSKWVPIPAAELQAAADAAAAAARKANTTGHTHSQGPRKGNKGSNSNSTGNTHANNTNGTNTSAHNTPRTHSGRTSAAQSRVHSVQNSPRAQRGRRLPLEEGIDATGPPSLAPSDVPPIGLSQPPINQQQQQQQQTTSTYQPQPHAPYPQQQQYNAMPPPPTTHTPIIGQRSPAPNAPTPEQAYVTHSHRHRSHPMQPAVPTVPSPAPAFQVSAPPFYPQSHHLPPPPPGDPTSPPGAAFQVSNRGPVYPPLHGAYAPPHGPPPMYPVYAPPGFGYGAWQAPPPPVYGPLSPHQHQQGYAPLQYVEGPPPPPNVLGVDEAVRGDVTQPQGEVGLEGGERGAVSASSPSASSPLREKMMFGSIDLSAVPKENLVGDVEWANGVKVNGESGSAEVSRQKEEQNAYDQEMGHVADGAIATDSRQEKDAKGKAERRTKATNGLSSEREREGTRPSGGRQFEGAIPAVQAAQGVQAEIKWKFGTANNTPPVQRQQALPPVEDAPPPPHLQQQPTEPTGVLHASSTMPALSAVNSNHSGDGLPAFPVALDPRGSASFAHLPPILPLPSLMSTAPVSPAEHGLAFGDALVPSLPSAGTDSDLDVKDYGYGFGDASGSGYATALLREERLIREREFEAEREREMMLWREENQKAVAAAAAAGIPTGFVGGLPAMDDGRIDEGVVAPEAGPSHGGYTPIREHGPWRGGPPGGDGGHFSGARGGRRGGGTFGSGPGGRGYGGSERGGGYGGRRGRGANGYSRGYGRGGYSRGGGGGGGAGSISHRPPPFTVTPPQHLHPLVPVNELHQPGVGAPYYPPPRQMGAPYLPPPLGPNGFDGYGPPPPLPAVNGVPPVPQISPPVPAPLSPISFPLDPTRYYLLGQLEYYLSPQNMAQDFFLRQRMDVRGWIPISLIASFNRVKQLTMDIQFVKDVLALSSLVQVRGSMVRMSGWERFVLPDAAPSSVEDQPLPHAYQNLGTYPDEHSHQQQQANYQSYQHQNQPIEQNGQQYYHQEGGPNSAVHWHADGMEGPNGTSPLVNGHASKSAHTSHMDGEDDEEDEEEDVVFVMGHEVGTWSPERGP